MPHDKNGAELKVGDKVTVECEITSICEGDYCTTDLKTVEVMPGNGQPTTISAINAKQLVKVVAVVALAIAGLFGSAAPADAGHIRQNIQDRRDARQDRRHPAPQMAAPVAPVGVPAVAAVPVASGCAAGNCALPGGKARFRIFGR